MKTRKLNVATPAPVEPTKPLSVSHKLKVKLANMEEHNLPVLERWGKRYAEDAANAFEWSDDVFAAAAKVAVAHELGAGFVTLLNTEIDGHAVTSEDERANKLLDYAEETMRTLARNPARSTSVPSNVMAGYKLAAYAEVVNHVRYNRY